MTESKVCVALAFLQCQWFRNPDRVRAIYARHAGDYARRAALNARFLFYKSLTGNRIFNSFGALRELIVWEEVSTEIGENSSDCFPSDINHMCKVIDFHRPSIVLTFGKIASEAIRRIDFDGTDHHFKVIKGPHPAARHASVVEDLDRMAEKLRSALPSFPPAYDGASA